MQWTELALCTSRYKLKWTELNCQFVRCVQSVQRSRTGVSVQFCCFIHSLDATGLSWDFGLILCTRLNTHCSTCIPFQQIVNDRELLPMGWQFKRLKFRGVYCSRENHCQSYGALPAIWGHTVLPATRHRWTRVTLTPVKQAGNSIHLPRGMKGWVGPT